jgi:tRNA(fMet)-specific endonuclease VapC
VTTRRSRNARSSATILVRSAWRRRRSVVPFDHRTARTAADLLRTLDDRGDPIGTLDALVAATALVRDDPVVTRNVSEFDRVDGLTVSPY